MEGGIAKQVTITQARDQLSAHVHSTEHGTPVVITRRGHAVAAIVVAADVERLGRLRPAGPQAGLAGLVGGWEGLVGKLAGRHHGPPRWSPEPDVPRPSSSTRTPSARS